MVAEIGPLASGQLAGTMRSETVSQESVRVAQQMVGAIGGARVLELARKLDELQNLDSAQAEGAPRRHHG